MKTLLILVLIIASLLASACISDESAPREEPTENTSQPDTVPLIPREVFFGNPDKIIPCLSPDGTRISYLAPVDGVLNVWVGPADTQAQQGRSQTTPTAAYASTSGLTQTSTSCISMTRLVMRTGGSTA